MSSTTSVSAAVNNKSPTTRPVGDSAALKRSASNSVDRGGTRRDGLPGIEPRQAACPATTSADTLGYAVDDATAGDHHGIFQLLTTVFANPSRDAFLASLDDPFYEPNQRLVARRHDRLLAHVHRIPRTMQFDHLQIPICQLSGLGTLPEFRGQGIAQRLLQEAERRMAAEGAMLGILRTRIPHFFRAAGWAVCGRHSHSRVRTRDLLSQLIATESDSAAQQAERLLRVRPWRQVELPALMRLHQAWQRSSFGSIERTEAYWRWLISRKQFDQIFVAVEGPDRQELDDVNSPIVGYVVMRGQEVLELIAAPGHEHAARQLLMRACGEAVERDLTSVILHAPPNDPLHPLFQAAGGLHLHHESVQGEVFMARLLDPVGFLRWLCPELHRRAEEQRLPRPFELGLLLGGQKHRIVATRRSVKLLNQKLGRSYLSMNDAEFTRLLLGHVNLDDAVASGRLEVSTRVAFDLAQALFPQRPLWHPPLDAASE